VKILEMDSSSDEEDAAVPRKRPKFNERRTYDYPADFRERFRFTPALFDRLLAEIGPYIEPKVPTNHALSAREKLMVALRFYASGQFYYSIGDAQGKTF
jgi:hypothetical protein